MEAEPDSQTEQPSNSPSFHAQSRSFEHNNKAKIKRISNWNAIEFHFSKN
jgi:hypothetical protein